MLVDVLMDVVDEVGVMIWEHRRRVERSYINSSTAIATRYVQSVHLRNGPSVPLHFEECNSILDRPEPKRTLNLKLRIAMRRFRRGSLGKTEAREADSESYGTIRAEGLIEMCPLG